jgi:hypothetical protein
LLRLDQFPTAGRLRQGVFGRAAGCLSDSEFLPVWKKYPGAADTRRTRQGVFGRAAGCLSDAETGQDLVSYEITG